jgi:hypothetical protein
MPIHDTPVLMDHLPLHSDNGKELAQAQAAPDWFDGDTHAVR